jgi:hypothetical protein
MGFVTLFILIFAGVIALEMAQDRNHTDCVYLLKHPPKLSGLPQWRPSLHSLYPAAFKQNTKYLLILMVRLRQGPLREMHRDIVKIMIRKLADMYRGEEEK